MILLKTIAYTIVIMLLYLGALLVLSKHLELKDMFHVLTSTIFALVANIVYKNLYQRGI